MRASESDRALICPASLVLPRTREKSESVQDAADWGTLAHHWKETGDADPFWAGVSHRKTLKKKLEESQVDREFWWPTDDGMHEVTFALDLESMELRLLPAIKDRDEWKAGFTQRDWLTGTIDYLAGCDVDDLKTGRWPVNPATSGQLKSYALVPWVMEGYPDDYSAEVSITHWPKYPLAGQPVRTRARVTGFQLREHLDDLRYAVAHPDELNRTDEGCLFCDCKPTCSAWVDDNDNTNEGIYA